VDNPGKNAVKSTGSSVPCARAVTVNLMVAIRAKIAMKVTMTSISAMKATIRTKRRDGWRRLVAVQHVHQLVGASLRVQSIRGHA